LAGWLITVLAAHMTDHDFGWLVEHGFSYSWLITVLAGWLITVVAAHMADHDFGWLADHDFGCSYG